MTPEQFWARVARGHEAACWPWLGHLDRHARGKLSHEGKTYYAHRLAYELTHGPIPAGGTILHLCDTPPCCNPGHLVAGSQAENVEDMVRKGRARNQATGRLFKHFQRQALPGRKRTR